jgi:pyruvate formate lyase activating enzyme
MSSEIRALIFDIKRFALHDGPGIRTTAFIKGCPLACVWCQNPEGIESKPVLWYSDSQCIRCEHCIEVCPENALESDTDKKPFINIDRAVCDRAGNCVKSCPSGALHWDSRSYSAEELTEQLVRDAAFYESSGGGITLSGGEPLFQAEFSLEVLKKCKNRGFQTAIETTLYASRSVIEKTVPYVDLYLADLKLINNEEHKKYTGVENVLILKNMEYLAGLGRPMTIRVPLIPGLTDTEENITGIAKFVTCLEGDIPIELLNFNPLAESKYVAMGLQYRFAEILSKLPDEKVTELKSILQNEGCRVA